jgi:hypothetical protein
MEELIHKTAGFADSLDLKFVERIQHSPLGEVVGFLSTFLKNHELRDLYKEVLETPIMALNKPVQKGQVIENQELKFHGGFGSFRGRPMIFVNPYIDATEIVPTLFEEGAHALRRAKGRPLHKTDLTSEGFSEKAYRTDPEEISAKKLVEYAMGVASGKIKTAAGESIVPAQSGQSPLTRRPSYDELRSLLQPKAADTHDEPYSEVSDFFEEPENPHSEREGIDIAKDASDEEKEYFFHFTTWSNAKRIERQGIKRGPRGYVWCCDNLDACLEFAEGMLGDRYAIVEFQWPASQTLPDEDFEGEMGEVYRMIPSDIPRSSITDIAYHGEGVTASKTAAQRGIWFHGSSIRNLRSILKQGLVPYPKERNWATDPDAGIRPSRESYGGCYDDETRILTKSGFKYFYKLLPKDEVATLVDGKELRYEVPTASIRYWYEGPMYAFDTRFLNLIITPDHRVYWRNRVSNASRMAKQQPEVPFKLSEVSSVIGTTHTARGRSYPLKSWKNVEFKRDAEWRGAFSPTAFEVPKAPLTKRMRAYEAYKSWTGFDKDFCRAYGVTRNSTYRWKNGISDPQGKYVKQPSNFRLDDWLEFLGWYLSEGSLDDKTRICLSQKKVHNRKSIKTLFARMGLVFSEYPNGFKFSHFDLYAYLAQFGFAENKFIPQEIKDLPSSKLEIILSSLMSGDGHHRSDTSGIYSSVSKRMAEDVAEIALKCGYGISLAISPPTTGKIKGKLPCYRIYLSKRSPTSLCGKPAIIDFKGWVSCVQVSSGVIFVERKGKTCWSGNSYVTTDLMTAMSSPKDHNAEGREVVVCLSLQPSTFYLDEDDINFYVDEPFPSLSDSTNTHYALSTYIAMTQPNDSRWKDFGESEREKYINEVVSGLTFKWGGNRGEKNVMHPELEKNLRSLLPGMWMAALTRIASYLVFGPKRSDFDRRSYDVAKAYTEVFPHTEWEAVPPMDKLFPTQREGEEMYKWESERLTRALRLYARPHYKGSYRSTARVDEPIGFGGSNRILAVVEVRDGRKYLDSQGSSEMAKTVEMVLHYGEIPQEFFKQFKERYGYQYTVTRPQEPGRVAAKVAGKVTSFPKEVNADWIINYVNTMHGTTMQETAALVAQHIRAKGDRWVLKPLPLKDLYTPDYNLSPVGKYDNAKIQEYQEMDTDFPPIVFDGNEIFDGMHRAAAAKGLGYDEIWAYVPVVAGKVSAQEPWEMSQEEFYRTHPKPGPGYSSYAEGDRIDALPDDTEMWVYHSTDRETAQRFLADGIDPVAKPLNLARIRYEKGEYAEFAPGRGIGRGLYVAATPADASGYGRVTLAIRVRKGDLEPSPEAINLGNKTIGHALAVNDAMVVTPVPKESIRMIGQPGRYPRPAHDQFVQDAIQEGRIPSHPDYPDIGKSAGIKTARQIGPVYHGTPKLFNEFVPSQGQRTMWGLVPISVKSGVFFFTPDAHTARNWAENRSEQGQAQYVLTCEISMDNPVDMRTDAWIDEEVAARPLPLGGIPQEQMHSTRDTKTSPWTLLEALREYTEGRLNEIDWKDMGIDINRLEVIDRSRLFFLLDSKEVVDTLRFLKYDGVIYDEGEDPELGGVSYGVFSPSQVKILKRTKVADLEKKTAVDDLPAIGEKWDKLASSPMRIGWLRTQSHRYPDIDFGSPWTQLADDQKKEITLLAAKASQPGLNHKEAVRMRQSNGNKEKALNKVVGILGAAGIGSLVVGGIAVQEHGFVRNTKDIDLSVSDFIKARRVLAQNGYRMGNGIVVFDPEYGEEIDLLQAGQTVATNKVPMPRPTSVNTSPKVCDLTDLINLKIGSFLGAEGVGVALDRIQDRDDIYKLMGNNQLPRGFLHGKMYEKEYTHMWDVLHAPPRKLSHEEAVNGLLDIDNDGLIAFHKKEMERQDKTAAKAGIPTFKQFVAELGGPQYFLNHLKAEFGIEDEEGNGLSMEQARKEYESAVKYFSGLHWPLSIYRAIAGFGGHQRDNIGICWSLDPNDEGIPGQGAWSYGSYQRRYRVYHAKVMPKDINWIATLGMAMGDYFSSEQEVRLKDGARVPVVGVRESDGQWEEMGFKWMVTASEEPEVSGLAEPLA